MNYQEKWEREEFERVLLITELKLGRALVNHTNGYVYLNSKGRQVKINIGKARKDKDFSFSNIKYWRVASLFETIRIKTGLYRLWKVEF